MKRLINSSSSSAVIHENIIGYHFCKYNDKSTRDGERFVKNLVQLIGKAIPKYQESIYSNQLIQDMLMSSCNDNPVKCFQKAIVEPLQTLDSTGRKNLFILIDALDECMEKEESHKSIILNILIQKVSHLPNWVKLIATSGDQPMFTTKILRTVKLSNLTVSVEDKRNKEDLSRYANRTLQNVITETLLNKEVSRIHQLIYHALDISEGNFLFLKRIIKHWQEYPDKMNVQSIPESLEDLYVMSFTERFKKKHLERFEPFFEILLATNSPLTLVQLAKILEHHFGKNYNTREVANSLSEYFKADINRSPLEFRHQFFTEWLINQTAGKAGIVIDKSRGHHYIFDYLLNFYEENQSNLTFKELSELCAHFLHGKKTTQSNLRRLGSLKASEIRDNRTERCILHDLASRRDATELIAEFLKQFNSVDIQDIRRWTPIMYAVEAGNIKNVMVFIRNGANLIIERKALHLAAVMGRYEIVRIYISHGAQPDVISLHHAAARNHTKIVRLFLDAGVRDECLPCKSENKSWCNTNINRFHLCMCETALYAAVSGNNLEMAKLILQNGYTSVNCSHGSGRTALMEAFSQRNIQMVELLINAGADINAECKSPLTPLMYNCYDNYDSLYIRYCKQPVCDGNRVIDFSFAYGLWEVMTPFISKGKLNISSDNAKWNLETVAVIYDRVDFIIATYGYSMESTPNIETVLRYVAVCHSVRTLEYLLYSEDVSVFTTVYEGGKTLLHFAMLGSLENQTKVYITPSCPSSACICPKITNDEIVDEKRLKTVMLLTKVLMLDTNKQDKYGRTALHYAVVQVLPEIVKYLVNAGANWSVKDKRGDTALEFALRERPYLHNERFQPCQLTSDYVFEICQSTIFDELASYLLRMETITECDMRAKSLLGGLLHHRLPLSLYSLFKSGLDFNCARKDFIKHLNQIVFNGDSRERGDLLEIFNFFQIDVQVICGVPFRESELHLMAFCSRKPSFQVGNLFKPTNSKDVETLNECYDKEGYLPIHRAVQGGNTFAVSWFIEIGVDVTRKTKSGFTILVLAIRRLLDHYSKISEFREDYILQQILKITKEKNLAHAFFQCNSDISPLHVAASYAHRYD